MIAKYRDIAKVALNLVFPNDDVLTPAQRTRVVAMIDAETAFGLFPTKITAALDSAQGTVDGRAASAWRSAIPQPTDP